MSKELVKRIITSILLFMLTIFCIFIDYKTFFIAVLIISGIAWSEINTITHRITRDNFLINLLTLFYSFGIFAAAAAGLYLLLGSVFFLYILSICICSDIGG